MYASVAAAPFQASSYDSVPWVCPAMSGAPAYTRNLQ